MEKDKWRHVEIKSGLAKCRGTSPAQWAASRDGENFVLTQIHSRRTHCSGAASGDRLVNPQLAEGMCAAEKNVCLRPRVIGPRLPGVRLRRPPRSQVCCLGQKKALLAALFHSLCPQASASAEAWKP